MEGNLFQTFIAPYIVKHNKQTRRVVDVLQKQDYY